MDTANPRKAKEIRRRKEGNPGRSREIAGKSREIPGNRGRYREIPGAKKKKNEDLRKKTGNL